jgi:hypothetical protein
VIRHIDQQEVEKLLQQKLRPKPKIDGTLLYVSLELIVVVSRLMRIVK